MKTKVLIIAASLALSLSVQAQSNRQRVLKRHPEARCRAREAMVLNAKTNLYDVGKMWVVTLKPKCGPNVGERIEVGSDTMSSDTAWFTALEWVLAYDYCK